MRALRFVLALSIAMLALSILPGRSIAPRAVADPLDPPRTGRANAGSPPPTTANLSATNPFPAAMPPTEAIEAIAAELNALPQPLQPPDGALPVVVEPAQIEAEALRQRVLLPMLVNTRQRQPDPQPRPDPADVALAVWATPSVRVMRGGLLSYELRLINHGAGEARAMHVRFPYPRHQLTLIDARFETGRGDWVSEITADTINVSFGPLAPGARRSATLVFRVGSALPNDTVINVRASHSWSDGRSGGSGAANWTPVLLGAGDVNSAYLWLAVHPASGKAGTVHQFFTDRFIPGEGVITWLNTPAGVRPLELRGIADNYGRIWLSLSSAGLAPGNYSLVVYGTRSRLTGVAGFTVQP